MPFGRLCRDLTPNLSEVPASTWEGTTPEGVRAILEEFSTADEPGTLSLRALAASVKLPVPTEEERALLHELSPPYLDALDARIARSV
jgi:hypothetical protein